MISRIQSRRLVAMAFLVAIAFVCLGYRLVELQVVDQEKYWVESQKSTRKVILSSSKRGEIRDIRGNRLAGTVFVKTVYGDPNVIGEHRTEVARAIAPLLQMPESEMFQRLAPKVHLDANGKPKTNGFAILKKRVPIEVWERVQLAMKEVDFYPPATNRFETNTYNGIRMNGLGAMDEQFRMYPNQSLAAHIIGCVGPVEIVTATKRMNEVRGQDGIEASMDAALRGVVGWRSTEVAKAKELVAFREQDVQAKAGLNVVLTLDAGIQHIVEAELANAMEKHTPLSISAIVVKPRTGEILAMANLPTYNPNDVSASQVDDRRNRAVANMIEPGSTFKIVVVSGALSDGLVTLDDRFDCENGLFVFAGHKLRDHEPYGVISVEEIITHSSNIGAAKIGLKMGQDRLLQYMHGFGFGARTGIPLFGEASGMVHPLNKWTKLSISRIPMGHEVAVTPLQMVMAMSSVANGGKLMRPMLVNRLEDEQGDVMFQYAPQAVRQVISERAAREMVTALKTVVSTNGTGRRAALEHYTVAGKTGTAQKLVGTTYSRTKHFSSFIGFFPADNPEVCIGVFMDEPKNGYYGGEAPALTFRPIAERVSKYLAIQPDVLPPEPSSPPVPTVPSGNSAGNGVSVAMNRIN